MNIKLAFQLFRNMGIRYTLYRIKYEFDKHLGTLEIRTPQKPIFKNFISLQNLRLASSNFTIKEREVLSFDKVPNNLLKEQKTKILNNEICYFNNEWINLGDDYDWVTNPVTKYKYDNSIHWSKIEDYNAKNGDIKYVWEKSRFSYFLTLIRNDFHHNEDHSEFIFSEIESWIEHNPINQGPNWKCSQEISLRLFNWIFAISFYKNSNALTAERWKNIQNTIYWSLEHVYKNINFSRIAVRNNHAITETLILTLSEFLFPYIPETKIWARKGRKWFEEEIEYQIYEDGTFLQFSMNYHRVVIQLLSLGISLTEKNNKPFSPIVYQRAEKSLNFLYQCLQEENGCLPNYGSNDGALFFPLTNSDYLDYRPQLNTLHYLLYGVYIYDENQIKEDSLWMVSHKLISKNKIIKQQGLISFPIGGYYLIREEDTFTFIRCGNHNDRPAHADNLHIDVWVKGINILRDSGSYKYNTERELLDYFTGTQSHNTVTVENYSQMLKGNRFIWYYWSQSKGAKLTETETDYLFEGTISAFRFLNPKATHYRKLLKKKSKKEWTVIDKVEGLSNHSKTQIWHHDKHKINFEVSENENKVTANNSKSYCSKYYGVKEIGNASSFTFENQIETRITLKS